MKINDNDLLVAIDIQNDFCTGGSLAVPDGEEVVPVVNNLLYKFEHAIATQDWHSKKHNSFASSHSGKNPFEEIQVSYGPQILWPDHCIAGSAGAALHKDLSDKMFELVLRKGFRRDIDSYSIFYENDGATATGLNGYLKEREITTIYLTGLAYDFCVKWSALDGRRLGYNVFVIEDAARAIDLERSKDYATAEMTESGVEIIHSSDIN